MTNLKPGVSRKQSIPNVIFSENLACFVFLKHPFWDSPPLPYYRRWWWSQILVFSKFWSNHFIFCFVLFHRCWRIWKEYHCKTDEVSQLIHQNGFSDRIWKFRKKLLSKFGFSNSKNFGVVWQHVSKEESIFRTHLKGSCRICFICFWFSDSQKISFLILREFKWINLSSPWNRLKNSDDSSGRLKWLKLEVKCGDSPLLIINFHITIVKPFCTIT